MAIAELVRNAPAVAPVRPAHSGQQALADRRGAAGGPVAPVRPARPDSEGAGAPARAPWGTPTGGPPGRLAYLDGLKVALTALVIAHHAGQAYGPTGGRWPVFEAERAPILGPFFAVNAAFFMGLFFFLSGLFLPGSLDRKGAAGFLRDRLVRLGVPLVAVALALFAPIGYATYAEEGGTLSFLPFLLRVYIGQWRVEVGHLWFTAHLLVYGVAYAAWRALQSHPITPGGTPGASPGEVQDGARPLTGGTLLAFALALAASSFLVRLAFPIDRWVSLFGFLPTEPAHLPQYVALFAAGVLAARRRWIETLATGTGLSWLAIGGTAAALRYAYPSLRHLAGPGVLPPLSGGGATAGSLLWSTWEAVICVGLCAGLVVLFRERVRVPGRLLRAASPNAYGAYVLHLLPVVGLQLALVGVPLPPLGEFALVTASAVPLSFLAAAALRRLPGVRAVL